LAPTVSEGSFELALANARANASHLSRTMLSRSEERARLFINSRQQTVALANHRNSLDIDIVQAYFPAIAKSQAWVLKLSCMLT